MNPVEVKAVVENAETREVKSIMVRAIDTGRLYVVHMADLAGLKKEPENVDGETGLKEKDDGEIS